MVSIAERTAEIATGKTDENHWSPCPEAFALERIEYFVDPIHLSFVGSHIHLRLPNLYTIGILYIVADPAGNILRCRVERENLIEILMVQGCRNLLEKTGGTPVLGNGFR